MEFTTEAQKTCYEQVKTWMQEIFGEMAFVDEKNPTFGIARGTAQAWVWVLPWGDDDATINVRSWVVTDAEMTLDLAKYLLQQNFNMRFGAFSIDDEDDILFSHTIVGSTCQKEELRASVMAVLSTADAQDDPITSRFGGRKASDR